MAVAAIPPGARVFARRLLIVLALGGLPAAVLLAGGSASASPGAIARTGAAGAAGWPAGSMRFGTATPVNYVALGDSYTSGPLIPDPTGSPVGCLRSDHNYPHLAARALGASLFTDASCQGATTDNMTQPEGVGIGANPPQLSALSASTTLVTLQIGGNDINFADIVINCTSLSLTNPFGSPCKDHYTAGGTDRLRKAIDATAPKVGAVLQAIHQRAPNARVLLLGYPVILPDSGSGCWPVVPVAYGDVPYLRGVEIYLNKALAAQAAQHGATYVDTYTASAGHDFCQAPGVKWVEGIVPTSPAAPVHPNALGEQGMARQVVAAAG
jgi:lysophospholipase L1-like esterase